jgi:pyruvate dehydrogenase E2 component (dihydrolipoamide acetyltransferase)
VLRKVIMPTLGLDMEEAVIEKWLKREGDSVVEDEPLVLVETEKASTEINSPMTGILKQILEPDAAIVQVTHTIALIETSEPDAPEDLLGSSNSVESQASPSTPNGKDGAAETLAASSVAARSEAGAVRASPVARQAARELGVDLHLVTGSGPLGRIQGEDVRRFAEMQRREAPEAVAAMSAALSSPHVPAVVEKPAAPRSPEALPGRLVPLSRKRKVTAERMALSARSVARITLNMEIDASAMIALRSRLLPIYKGGHGVHLSYTDLLVKVVATALLEHPHLNSRWTDQGILLVEPVNVGVAVAVDDGLVVPVVRNADRKKLMEISTEMGRLLGKARENKLGLEDMTGGTFTITNLGMFGIDSFTPIVNPPETAILGVGRIVEKPVGRDGQIVLRPMMTLSLSFDHRVLDGAPAAQFLECVRRLLEEPYLLM